MQTELLDLLAARKGHFRLESGHHGDLWLDLDRLFLRPRQVRRFAGELAAKLARYPVAAVCGPLVGGALLAQAIAAELDVEFYYTQRFVPSGAQRDALYPIAYRLPNSLRRIVAGKHVAIVDDVINAGSAVRAAWEELRFCGARPVVIGALLVLGSVAPGFFAEQHVPLESVATLASGLWAPVDCPLCASGTPLEDMAPTPESHKDIFRDSQHGRGKTDRATRSLQRRRVRHRHHPAGARYSRAARTLCRPVAARPA